MRGQGDVISLAELPYGLAFDLKSGPAREYRHPLGLVLIVPKAWGRGLSVRDDALNPDCPRSLGDDLDQLFEPRFGLGSGRARGRFKQVHSCTVPMLASG